MPDPCISKTMFKKNRSWRINITNFKTLHKNTVIKENIVQASRQTSGTWNP